MATYKSAELLKMISEIINDGYKYVEVYESEGFEDEEGDGLPTGLSFNAISSEFETIDYECVDSCKSPTESDIDSPQHFKGSDICGSVSFTFDEIFTIKHSVDNALEYFKECTKDPKTSKDALSEIKSSSISCRNLQSKLAKLIKGFKIS